MSSPISNLSLSTTDLQQLQQQIQLQIQQQQQLQQLQQLQQQQQQQQSQGTTLSSIQQVRATDLLCYNSEKSVTEIKTHKQLVIGEILVAIMCVEYLVP